MTEQKYCPICTEQVSYVNKSGGMHWVHVDSRQHLSRFPYLHDANTYAPSRLLSIVEIPERVQPYIVAGIIATESCPEQHFWRWLVLRPELLPADLQANYEENGEIRWYPDR